MNDKRKIMLKLSQMAKRKRKKTTPAPVKEQKIEQAHGQGIQSGGNDAKNQPSVGQEKSTGKKLALWLGIVVAVLTIATFFLDLPEKLRKNWLPASARYYGKVVDAKDNGVGGAEIFVLEKVDGDTLGIGQTLPNGDFNFIVQARRESSVFVCVAKDGHVGFSENKVLAAGDKILFE